MIKSIQIWAEEVAKFFKSETRKGYTCWYELGEDEFGNTLAIVAGFPEDFDFPYMYFGTKKANSLMSEYGIDWLMPYVLETGEVYDTEIPLSDKSEDIEWLLEAYKSYMSGEVVSF